jgi:hypothetical protein
LITMLTQKIIRSYSKNKIESGMLPSPVAFY